MEGSWQFTSALNLWIAETYYPKWKDLEELFEDKGPDQSAEKTTFNGWQFDTTEKIKKYKLDEWFQDICRKRKIPIKNIKVNQSWCILYEDGGYQHLHCHGPTLISMVIHLDLQPELEGMLYTIIPKENNEMIINNYLPTPGQTIILAGRVFHGVYPCKAGRRTVVVDFDFDYLQPSETHDQAIWGSPTINME